MPPKRFAPDTPGKRIATARRLMGAREGRDILPPALAEMVGVSQGSVYAWEDDSSTPREDTLAKLARVLGVTPEWIRYGVEPQPAPKPREIDSGEVVRGGKKPGAKEA